MLKDVSKGYFDKTPAYLEAVTATMKTMFNIDEK